MIRIFEAKKCFLRETHEDIHGKITETYSCAGFACPEGEAFAIEATGNALSWVGFLNLTANELLWTIVFFTEPILEPAVAMAARGDLKHHLMFSARTDQPMDPSNPPIFVLHVNKKSALASVASKHRCFEKSWEALKDLPEDKNWVVVIDLHQRN